jgi:hypothetical protein
VSKKKSKKSNKTTFGDLLRLADERGIEVPVILWFDPDPRAAAAYAALAGQPLPAGADAEDPAALVRTVEDAAGALRAHGGLGGRLVANLLEAPPEPVVRWLFSLAGERACYRVATYYDRLPYCCCPDCAEKPGPVTLFVPVSVGNRETALRLTGPDAPSVTRTFTLAKIAAERRLPSLGDAAHSWALPVGADELATILSEFYSDAPRLVAKVLRALGRERHPGRQWLLSTLRTAPGLGKLAQQVDRLMKRDAG